MKRAEVKDQESFQKYILEKNTINKRKIIICILLNVIFLYMSFKLLTGFIFEIYLTIGIIGTSLVGYSAIESGKSIIEFSSTKWNYNLDKAESLLKSKLYTGIGTIFLLTSLIVGYYINCTVSS
ncbi:hypothetical protein [Methanosarcina vacuolata]|uniref:hypothetical protein n=1 Tax=Methanosarcina vacuolata TaxID=2215 RepID=UPI00064E18D5|nr:hypothetical protein [Methanosarcina vacuolata]